MRVSIVVAVARNGVIGHRGGIPWRLPDDLRFFRALTTGHCIVLGRRTFESIGRALPKRLNLVLTRRPSEPVPGVEFLPDLEAALARAREQGCEECFLVGGEAVYREGLSRATRIYRTLVEARPEGDTFFPEIDERVWRCVHRDPHPSDERHAHAFVIETWERVP